MDGVAALSDLGGSVATLGLSSLYSLFVGNLILIKTTRAISPLLLLCVLFSACSESPQTRVAEEQIDFAANAQRWISEEFQPSTLSQAEQAAELAWFTQAAEPYRGMSINVVSETLMDILVSAHGHREQPIKWQC